MLEFIMLQAAGAGYGNFIMIGLMGVVFYMFIIRPQQKKAKEQKKYVDEVSKGDTIVTLGGIHGKIVSVEDTTISLEIDKGVKIIVEKSSISMEASKNLSTKA